MSYYTRIIILIITLTFAVSFGSASGNIGPIQHPTSDPVTLALELAEKYWKAAPCNGQIILKSSLLKYNQTSQSGEFTQKLILENAYEPVMRSEWNEIENHLFNCVTTINSKDFPNWYVIDYNFHEFCDDITHELGHYLGHHDIEQTNPSSINYPIVEFGSPNYNSVPQCININLWYGNILIKETYMMNKS